MNTPAAEPARPSLADVMHDWLQRCILHEPMVELAKLNPRFLAATLFDELDPDDRSLYYNSEGRAQFACSLGNLRTLARIAQALLAWSQDHPQPPPPNLAQMQQAFETAMSTIEAYGERVRRDALAGAKDTLLDASRLGYPIDYKPGLLAAAELVGDLMQPPSARRGE